MLFNRWHFKRICHCHLSTQKHWLRILNEKTSYLYIVIGLLSFQDIRFKQKQVRRTGAVRRTTDWSRWRTSVKNKCHLKPIFEVSVSGTEMVVYYRTRNLSNITSVNHLNDSRTGPEESNCVQWGVSIFFMDSWWTKKSSPNMWWKRRNSLLSRTWKSTYHILLKNQLLYHIISN